MKDIYCLAIESSCDETSMSIIKNGIEEIETVTNTQIDIHKEFGGVVPEIASRSHIENITIENIFGGKNGRKQNCESGRKNCRQRRKSDIRQTKRVRTGNCRPSLPRTRSAGRYPRHG